MTVVDKIIIELRREMDFAGSDGEVRIAVPVLEYLLHRLEMSVRLEDYEKHVRQVMEVDQ